MYKRKQASYIKGYEQQTIKKNKEMEKIKPKTRETKNNNKKKTIAKTSNRIKKSAQTEFEEI